MSIKIKIKPATAAAFLLCVLFFTVIIIFKFKSPPPDSGLLSGFITALNEFSRENGGIYILLIGITGLGAVINFYRADKSVISASLISGSIIVLSLVSSLILVLIIAYANLWMFTLRTGSTTGPAGLIWNRQEIARKLQETDSIPVIQTLEQNGLPRMMLTEYFATQQTGTFYRQFIVSKIPETIIPVNVPESKVYLINGKLVFTGLNPDDLTALSPKLGYLIVKEFFKPMLIKSDAAVGILNRQDYIKLREDQISKQLSEIDSYSAKVDKLYMTAAKTVEDDKSGIVTSQTGLDKSTRAYDLELNTCMSAGYNDIFVGKFIRYHDDNYCQNKAKLDWGDKKDGFKQTLAELSDKLTADEKNLESVSYIKTVAGNYRSVVAAQINLAPEELGLFHDQVKIDIVLDYINARSVPAYLQTLVHEYLHYASFVSEQRVLPRAFEEGLTEYYTREAVKYGLGKDMVLGYPLLVKLIRQMASKIPADSLKNIYFTKDETELAKQLDTYYGKNFYEENSLQFEILPYLPPDKAVEIANMLMGKIGGQPVTADDLYSEISPKD